ncbi:hypothetical protein ABENE_18915 [Asticcacaulis benevestitus DSM 16100 = ATCC BAA-896]|uniref:Uncharacterized protein n=1 Tax=Asticcacaulis benevestitus DSM 16100 = ATCC BAA-896 TaxID=1121022 RepID=V4NUF6_9CAUL|nr:hypothetical protein ABENE_18915 [Asticcacaulis benevestitus DSM 16100 = ATCC BAA-896]
MNDGITPIGSSIIGEILLSAAVWWAFGYLLDAIR